MELLTTHETAVRLNVAVSTLRYWIQKGQAPPSGRIGRRRMFRSSDVDDWIQTHFDVAHANDSPSKP